MQLAVKPAINHLAASSITTDIALKPAILMIRRSGGCNHEEDVYE
jgi:hypothetical protein